MGRVAEHAAAAGRRPAVADVCAVAVSAIGASGGWVAAATSRGPDFVMCVTDRVSEQLAELHLTLGEGPGHDVLATAAPVLPADLGDGASGRGDPHLGDCLLLADTATVLLLDGLDGKRAADGDGDGSEPEMWPGGQSPNLAVHRVEIDQATGMLTVQLGSQPRKPLPGSGPLADFPPGLSLSGLGGLEADLEGILGTRVVLVPAVDLKPDVRQRVESDLIAL